MHIMCSCHTPPDASLPQDEWIHNQAVEFKAQTIHAVRNEIKPLNLSSPSESSDYTRNYFRYYDLDLQVREHYFGTFISAGKKIAAHIFMPLPLTTSDDTKTKGTVILVHGYLDHSGTYTKLIKELITQGYTIFTADLPGHGFSEGKRGSINDFSEYGELVKNLYEISTANLPGPYHIIGHSTGCSAIMEYLLSNNINPFTTCIFLAPLIHSTNWELAQCATSTLGFFISALPVFSKNAATNQVYIDFITKHDPLQVKDVTTLWAKAMIQWNKKLTNYMANPQKIIILQGTEDKTVDYTYNLPVIQKLFPEHKIIFIQGAGHVLCCETSSFRHEIFQLIIQALTQGEREIVHD